MGVCEVQQEVAYCIVFTAVCLFLDNLCGNVRVSAGSSAMNCMYFCVLGIGHFLWECEGSQHGVSYKFYELQCVGSWTLFVGLRWCQQEMLY